MAIACFMHCMYFTINNIANFPLSRFCVIVPLKYSKVIYTFALSTPSTSALVLSLALTVVLRKPSTYTWYISMMPGGQSGGFHPTKNNEKLIENIWFFVTSCKFFKIHFSRLKNNLYKEDSSADAENGTGK
jgi:hypothetical protein